MIPMKIRERAMAKEVFRLAENSSDIDERLILYLSGIPIRAKTSTEIYLKEIVEKASIEQQGRQRQQERRSQVAEQ